jgi:hypothetical protein
MRSEAIRRMLAQALAKEADERSQQRGGPFKVIGDRGAATEAPMDLSVHFFGVRRLLAGVDYRLDNRR